MTTQTSRLMVVAVTSLCTWVVSGDAVAGPITYLVMANTSSVNGTTGYIDLQFDPGFQTTQSAVVAVNSFATDGIMNPGSVQVAGDVTGLLPSSVTIGNSTQFNDYFEGLIFGDTVTFRLALSGPALTSPNGTALSGSTFGIGFYDSTGFNPILTTNVTDGFAGVINVNLDGTTTPIVFPLNDGVSISAISITAIPEPSSLWLVGVGILGLGGGLAWRRSRPLRPCRQRYQQC